MLETCCAPLHDIGKVGLPDHILLKPGRLAAGRAHPDAAHTDDGGGDALADLASHTARRAFLQMAGDNARHHHGYDGTGYPDRLVGDAIPLSGAEEHSRRLRRRALPGERRRRCRTWRLQADDRTIGLA